MRATLLSPWPGDTHWITPGTMDTVFASVYYNDNIPGRVELFWQAIPSSDNPRQQNMPESVSFSTTVTGTAAGTSYRVSVKVDHAEEDAHSGVIVKVFGAVMAAASGKGGSSPTPGIPTPPTIAQVRYNDYVVSGNVTGIPGSAYVVCVAYELDPATGAKTPTSSISTPPRPDGSYDVEISIPHNAGKLYFARVIYSDVNDNPIQKYTLAIGP